MGLAIVAAPAAASTTLTVHSYDKDAPVACEANLCCGLAYRSVQSGETMAGKKTGDLVVIEVCNTATADRVVLGAADYAFKCLEKGIITAVSSALMMGGIAIML